MFAVDELNLTRSMRNYWTNMITKGQPNDKNSLNWPRYSSKSDTAIVFDTKLTTPYGMKTNGRCFTYIL
jgi:carboxylesterase type B